jgi:hypothetical protein
MKKVAIVDYNFSADWFLHLIGDYIIESEEKDVPEKIIAWKSNTIILNDMYNCIAKFIYNEIEFTFIIGTGTSIDKLKEYDKVCTIEHKFLLNGLNPYTFDISHDADAVKQYKNLLGDKLVRLYFNMEEPVPSEVTDFNFMRNMFGGKIVSTFNDAELSKIDSTKFLYIPFISWIKFFYDKGYDYLNYEVSICKKNLVGSYFIPNYKQDRDYLIKQINQLLDLDDLNPVEVYKQSFPITTSQRYIEYSKEHWEKNHTTSYLDFGTSIVNIVFESSYQHGNWFTEKTLKAILFSKFSYNILYKDFNSLKLLKDHGFWFLNFEYIKWDTPLTPSETIDMIHDSIYLAIGEVTKLYKELKDYNLVMDRLDEKYHTNRMQNYHLIQDYIVNPIYRNQLLDFLFNDIFINKKQLL